MYEGIVRLKNPFYQIKSQPCPIFEDSDKPTVVQHIQELIFCSSCVKKKLYFFKEPLCMKW